MSTHQQVLRKYPSAVKFIVFWFAWTCLMTNVRGRQVAQAVKTIQTKDGDIYDCVDIYEQPTLKHPSFKGHEVQMWPSWFDPKGLTEEDKKEIKSIQISSIDEECVEGTVPILRMHKNVTSMAQADLMSLQYDVDATPPEISRKKFWALRRAKNGRYFGASAAIAVYGLNVGGTQVSTNKIWLFKEDMPSPEHNMMISAGWGVMPSIFGDSRTRFFINWVVEGKNCFNYVCPGFVQVEKRFSVGAYITPLSTIGGPTYVQTYYISKDPATGHWWLAINRMDNFFGYWHKNTFSPGWGLDHVTRVDYGGFASCLPFTECPPMGSGVNPRDYLLGSSHIEFTRLMYEDGSWNDLQPYDQTDYETSNTCYDVSKYTWLSDKSPGYFFYYGGSNVGKTC